MNIKRKFMQFARSFVTMDLRTTAQQQQVAAIKRKALRYQTLKHTAGVRADFGAALIAEDVAVMQHAMAYGL